ncbi:MAG: hypothetical protein PHW69_06270, partial [Elusimicrobiaceae bacterium]|nr:hypothetical protein [Elusimicrobiaceae bacterium]
MLFAPLKQKHGSAFQFPTESRQLLSFGRAKPGYSVSENKKRTVINGPFKAGAPNRNWPLINSLTGILRGPGSPFLLFAPLKQKHGSAFQFPTESRQLL